MQCTNDDHLPYAVYRYVYARICADVLMASMDAIERVIFFAKALEYIDWLLIFISVFFSSRVCYLFTLPSVFLFSCFGTCQSSVGVAPLSVLK